MAEIIVESVRYEIKHKGRVSQECVDRSREIALKDEEHHRRARYWDGVYDGKTKYKDYRSEAEKRWRREE